jgi:hypothetical protein
MKILKVFCLLTGFGFLSFNVSAQSEMYEKAMKENLGKMSDWSESPQSLTTAFEQIAAAEKTQWLPYYYAAYSAIVQSFTQSDAGMKDKTLDQAQVNLDAAVKLNPDISECMVLQGFLYVGRIQADPSNRGAEYSMKANESFDKAIEANPANPRGYYMKGVTVLNTPDFFGGGKEPAKPILTEAKEKFGSFVKSSPFSPDWGKQDCQTQLEACLK